jgi:probable rRNA maturation factor
MIESRRRRAAPDAEMPVLIDVEDERWRGVPGLERLAESAVAAVLAYEGRSADFLEVSILFTGDEEAARINGEWRNKTYAPNVLSFPARTTDVPAGEAKPLGDVILAAGVVAHEAAEQGKSLDAHTAHLIVHGMLHLLGHEHMSPSDASKMETAETAILSELGYPSPYEQ